MGHMSFLSPNLVSKHWRKQSTDPNQWLGLIHSSFVNRLLKAENALFMPPH